MSSRKRLVLWMLMAILVVAMMAGTSNVIGADKYVIKVATGTAESHPENIGLRKFEQLVEERTNSRVDVQVYPSGQLGSQKDFVEGLRMGTLEVTMVTIGFFSSYDPFLNIYELPYLYKDRDQAFRLAQGPLDKKIKARVEKHGVKIMAYWEAGLRHITNNVRPIVTPADLKGLKIRVPQSQINVDTFRAFGASPTPMNFGELYLAMQQGMVDGQENPFSNIYSAKFYEVQKYLSLSGHQFLIHMLMYSQQLWNKLPKDIQKIVLKSAQDAAIYQRQVVMFDDDRLLAVLKEKGMKINEVDQAAFRKATEPLYQEYIKTYGPEAASIIKQIQSAK